MMNARLIPMLSGALLLANAGTANAESIATGCLAKNGSIYAVNPNSNNTLAACRKGDQLIRLALHQPDTKFSKQRVTLPFESGQGMAEFPTSEGGGFGNVSVHADFYSAGFVSDYGIAPANACELFLFHDEIVYLLASVQPGGAQYGLTTVTVFHQDGRGHGEVPVPTDGMIRPFDDAWVVKVYDLRVVNYGTECRVAYMLEFADDPEALYSK
jgi:hypothetical protein